jgi:hypothetical protein
LFAFPFFLFVLAILAVFRNPGMLVVFTAIGLVNWVSIARVTRAQFISLREREYVEATRALGLPTRRVIFRHILPNALAPVIVQATLGMGSVIMVEAGLAFIGFGAQPPIPSWWLMISEGQKYLPTGQWWWTLFPGVAIMFTLLAFNFVGDGLRDALDSAEEVIGCRCSMSGTQDVLRYDAGLVKPSTACRSAWSRARRRARRRSGCGKSVRLFRSSLLPKPVGRIAGAPFFSTERTSRPSRRNRSTIRATDLDDLPGADDELNPVFTIGEQIMEPLRLHHAWTEAGLRKGVELLDMVSNPSARQRMSDTRTALGRHAPARDDRDGARVQPALLLADERRRRSM